MSGADQKGKSQRSSLNDTDSVFLGRTRLVSVSVSSSSSSFGRRFAERFGSPWGRGGCDHIATCPRDRCDTVRRRPRTFFVSVGDGGFWARACPTNRVLFVASGAERPGGVRRKRTNVTILLQHTLRNGDTEHGPPARVPLLVLPPLRSSGPATSRRAAADAYLQSEPKVSLRRAADVSCNIIIFGFCVRTRRRTGPGRPCDRNRLYRVKYITESRRSFPCSFLFLFFGFSPTPPERTFYFTSAYRVFFIFGRRREFPVGV